MHEHTFSIDSPSPLDGPDILHVHQRAFVQGYTNDDEPDMGASAGALEDFVTGEFAERKKSTGRSSVLTITATLA